MKKSTAWRSWPILALSILTLSAPFEARGQVGGEYRLGGDQIAVYNLAGEVTVVAGTGSDVVVEVTARGDDARDLRVESGPVRGSETLRVIYPSDRVVYPARRSGNTTLRVRDDGTFGRGDGGRRVRVSDDGRGMEAWADLRISVPPGKRFAVYHTVGTIEAENLDGRIRLDTGSGRVTARDMAGELTVDTGSGSVSVRGMAGNLLVDTGSGGVTVTDASGDEIIVDTGSGSVEGADLRARSVRIDTGSGGVTLERLAAPRVLVDTGSGSVRLDLLEDVEELDVDTGSGGVTIRIPPGLGAELELETGSGGIDTDVPVRIESIRRDLLRGTIGDGRGRIRVDTGSGGIRIRGG